MGWERIKSDNHQPFYTRRMTAGRANRQALNRGSSGGQAGQASGQAPEPSSRPLPVLSAQCSGSTPNVRHSTGAIAKYSPT